MLQLQGLQTKFWGNKFYWDYDFLEIEYSFEIEDFTEKKQVVNCN